MSHPRLIDDLPDHDLSSEIVESKETLNKKLNINVDCFCWVGGEEYSYGKPSHILIKKHYSFAFMTNFQIIKNTTDPYFLNRTNIESNYDKSEFNFYMSGIMDIFYYFKRMRIKKKLK